MLETRLSADEVLMVGDATTDRDAAEYADTLFYGIGDLLKGDVFPWGENLLGLNAWIEAHTDEKSIK